MVTFPGVMASVQSGDLIAWDYVAIAVYFALNLLVGAYVSGRETLCLIDSPATARMT